MSEFYLIANYIGLSIMIAFSLLIWVVVIAAAFMVYNHIKDEL